MNVKSITIKNFRNHSYRTFKFEKGLNIITGPNGAGKTNVAEAIYYLSLGKSFRSLEEDSLIKEGKTSAEINAVIEEGQINRKIDIIITPKGRQVLINNKKALKLSELSKSVNVLLFEPKDVLLFKGSPKNRRDFLDINISKLHNSYLDLITRYEKVLKQRNDALKLDNPDNVLLDTLADMLIDLSKSIIIYRQKFVKDINDILIKLTRALTGVNSDIKITYKPFVEVDANYQTNAKNAFIRALEGDLKKKATSIGVHREDFSIALNEREIGEFGSQGQNRMIALLLKISPYFLVEDKDKHPIIVLDDVMSELDQSHRLKLVQLLTRFEQVFITATRLEVKDASTHYRLNK